MTANAIGQLGKLATVTASGAVAAGKHSSFNAAAGALVATLPPLTTGAVATALAGGQIVRAKISKSKSDSSSNTVTVTCTSGDTFEGGTTTQALTVAGEKLTIFAATVSGASGPTWIVEEHTAPRDSLDLRFIVQPASGTTGQALVRQSDGTAAWATVASGTSDSQTKSDVRRILTNGDSITQGDNFSDGTAWPTYLQAALGSGVNVQNIGQGGWTSTEVGVLQGGIPMTLAAFTLPAATTTVTVTPTAPAASFNAPSAVPFSANGILTSGGISYAGTLARDSSSWKFNRAIAGSSVSIASGAIFQATQYDAYRDAVQTIAVGRNNITGPVVADVAAMVARLTPNVPRYLVIGVTTTLAETSGTAGYINVTGVNTALAATYGNRFIDVRRYLIDYGLTAAGLVATTADTAAIAADTVPPSLLHTEDNGHPNSYGKAAIAQAILARLVGLSWVIDKSSAIVFPTPGLPTGYTSRWKVSDLSALADNANVVSWPAASGSTAGVALTQSTTSLQPKVITSSGHRFVSFDGVNDELTFSLGSALAQPVTVITRGRIRSLAAGIAGLLWPTSTGGAFTVNYAGSASLYAGASMAGPNGQVVANQIFTGVAVFNGASSAVQIDSNTKVTGNSGTGGTQYGRIGYGYASADTWNPLDLQEYVIYPRVLTDSEIAQAVSYLATAAY